MRYEEELRAVQEREEEVPQKSVAPKKKKAKKVVEESDKEVKVVKVVKGKSGAKKKIIEDEARGSMVVTKPCER